MSRRLSHELPPQSSACPASLKKRIARVVASPRLSPKLRKLAEVAGLRAAQGDCRGARWDLRWVLKQARKAR